MNSISPGAVALFCGAPHDLRPLHKFIKQCPDQAGLTLAVAQGYVRVVLGLANGQHLGTSTQALRSLRSLESAPLWSWAEAAPPFNLAIWLFAKSRKTGQGHRLDTLLCFVLACAARQVPGQRAEADTAELDKEQPSHAKQRCERARLAATASTSGVHAGAHARERRVWSHTTSLTTEALTAAAAPAMPQ